MSSPNVKYFPAHFTVEQSLALYAILGKYPFEYPNVKVHDGTFVPMRQICIFNEPEIFTCGNTILRSNPWTLDLLEIKSKVEKTTQCIFNSLVEFYPSELVKNDLQKEDITSLSRDNPVATHSLDASRKIFYAKKGYKTKTYALESGSLLLHTNQEWTSNIDPQPEMTEGTITITFRQIVPATTTILKVLDSTSPDSSQDDSSLKCAIDDWEREYHIIPVENHTKRIRTVPHQ